LSGRPGLPVYRAASAEFHASSRMESSTGALSMEISDCLPFYVYLHMEIYQGMLPEPKTVHRGVNFKYPELKKQFAVNKLVVYYEPKSASIDKGIAEKFASGCSPGTVFILKLKKHFQIPETATFWPSEAEVLIPMFSAFKVVRCNVKDDGHDEVILEEVDCKSDLLKQVDRLTDVATYITGGFQSTVSGLALTENAESEVNGGESHAVGPRDAVRVPRADPPGIASQLPQAVNATTVAAHTHIVDEVPGVSAQVLVDPARVPALMPQPASAPNVADHTPLAKGNSPQQVVDAPGVVAHVSQLDSTGTLQSTEVVDTQC